MKKYLVFAGSMYDRYGGMTDFIGDYDNLVECKQAIDDWRDIYGKKCEWRQILNIETRKMVLDNNSNPDSDYLQLVSLHDHQKDFDQYEASKEIDENKNKKKYYQSKYWKRLREFIIKRNETNQKII